MSARSLDEMNVILMCLAGVKIWSGTTMKGIEYSVVGPNLNKSGEGNTPEQEIADMLDFYPTAEEAFNAYIKAISHERE